MASGIIDLHSLVRWIMLASLTGSAVIAVLDRKNFLSQNFKIEPLYLFTLSTSYLEFLLGLITYLNSASVQAFWAKPSEMFLTTFGFYGLFHPLVMIIAVALVTLGYRAFKKNTNSGKVSRYFIMAFLLVLLAIPWEFYPF